MARGPRAAGHGMKVRERTRVRERKKRRTYKSGHRPNFYKYRVFLENKVSPRLLLYKPHRFISRHEPASVSLAPCCGGESLCLFPSLSISFPSSLSLSLSLLISLSLSDLIIGYLYYFFSGIILAFKNLVSLSIN